MSNGKLETIMALLAKAEGTNSPEEAEAFSAKAEALMLKYGIEEAMLASKRPENGGRIVNKSIDIHDQFYEATVPGMWNVVQSFNDSLQMYYSKISGVKARVNIVGYESDVAMVEMLLASLRMQATTAERVWWSEAKYEYSWMNDSAKWRQRRTFLGAFFDGAAHRLRESRRQAVAESEPGTDLVLASRKDKVRSWMEENGPTLRKGRSSRQSGGAAARSAGFRKGQTADLGRGNRVGGGHGQIGR